MKVFSLQVGQWMSIIFYTLNLKGQDYVKGVKNTEPLLNKKCENTRMIGDNVLHVPIVNSMNSDKMEDTSELLKNIITEVLNYKQRQNINPNIINTSKSYLSNKIFKDANICIQSMKDSIDIQKPKNKTELNISSLSFLSNNNTIESSLNINFKDEENFYDKSICSNKKIFVEKKKATNKSVSHCCNETKENTQISIDFKPKCASTPKQTITNRSNNFTPRPIHKSYKKQYKNFSIDSEFKMKTKSNKDESVQRRFGASRILDVINETCTTIMKSVTNVFRSKKREDSLSQSYNSERQSQCANSFTNYMRRRDTMLEQDSTNSYWNDLMEEVQYECNTCNDTLSLRRKFSNDDFLRETVNKLKLGINLYGCNFKKISKTFWRDENYMTPTVLYNLYRKLILK
ncbi:PREDICTED: uncharacterized protein LOC106117474 isoform X1 [Papilio xuthus]|uniref:Uncharacterized protein LOC106117474 isoform X1 n=1 Tax=Papilio xuthus TaxID=66420 RepID=A0AAJ7E8P5_PAPXU|nr:PREDICTED: uncharacterized protein LOC106117474 isoform X1 [Papilio xuthus]